jgi:CheY-like chemotaxis protein
VPGVKCGGAKRRRGVATAAKKFTYLHSPLSQWARNSQKVLFVHEGCEDLCDCLDALEQFGYEVCTCDSYAAGLRCLEWEDFDLVVVCQGSPKFEGRCVLKRAMEINRRMRLQQEQIEVLATGSVDPVAASL